MDSNDDLWKLLSSRNDGDRNKGLKLLMLEMQGLITKELIEYGASLEDAEEVFYDGVLEIHVKGLTNRYSPKDNIQGLLRVICRRTWQKKCRKNKLKFSNIDDVVDYLTEDKVVSPSLLGETLRKKILHILGHLSSKCESIFILEYLRGFSQEEIKDELEYKSKGSLKNTKKRCKQDLLKIIESLGGKGFFDDFFSE